MAYADPCDSSAFLHEFSFWLFPFGRLSDLSSAGARFHNRCIKASSVFGEAYKYWESLQQRLLGQYGLFVTHEHASASHERPVPDSPN